MYQHRANVTPPPVDQVEAHTRAKFEFYRKAEAGINAGPAKVTYNTAPIQPRRKVAECGTHSGWKRHILDGTDPDRDCLDARAMYQRAYRARKCAV